MRESADVFIVGGIGRRDRAVALAAMVGLATVVAMPGRSFHRRRRVYDAQGKRLRVVTEVSPEPAPMFLVPSRPDVMGKRAKRRHRHTV